MSIIGHCSYKPYGTYETETLGKVTHCREKMYRDPDLRDTVSESTR